MKTTNEVNFDGILELWKKSNVDYGEMTFSCGGDSMGETGFNFYDKNGNVLQSIEIDELAYFFDSEVYNHVEFYDASDGNYLGEFGTVQIELNGDDFSYTKLSTSEYSESFGEHFIFHLTDGEFDLLNEKISNFNGDTYSVNMNYKVDCVITDDDQTILDNLEYKVKRFINKVDFVGSYGEPQDDTEMFDCNVLDSLNYENKTVELFITKTFYTTEEH